MAERQILVHRGVQCPALEVVGDLVAEEEVQHLLAKAPGESPAARLRDRGDLHLMECVNLAVQRVNHSVGGKKKILQTLERL